MPGIDTLPLMLVLMESNQIVGFFVTVHCISFYAAIISIYVMLSGVELLFVILGG
jgi:hypothetical protein